MNKQWFAVCTRPQHELKVAAALSKKGIDNNCPLTRKMLVSNGFRKKISHSPVFPSFVFVHITEAELNTVLRTPDVMNFMYWMGKPAIIADADIINMEQFAARYPNVMVKRAVVVKTPLAEAGLAIDEEDDNITQVLPSIGFMLTASREKNYRIINSNIERGRMMP
jgi:transcription antitermination factor NusG